MNTSIVACGEKEDIGCRVVLWDEPVGFNLYHGKYQKRDLTLAQLREKLTLFCLHHSVTPNAKATFGGLVGRGLSVNFIVDDDNVDGFATIYQCLDIRDIGYSQGEYNSFGPGVEISYYPQAWQDPGLYSEQHIKEWRASPHQVVDDVIHQAHLKVFAPTEAQVASVTALLKGYCRLFPKVKREFPRDAHGNFIKEVIKNAEGMVSHFNLSAQKIDPAGFPFAKVQAELDKMDEPCPSKVTETGEYSPTEI